MRGENMKVIEQLAGHKTIQMSARYAHLGEKNLRTAVEGLSTGARLHGSARKRTNPE
jgi:site-specific recombinase XerD